jgi:hypothetical protein
MEVLLEFKKEIFESGTTKNEFNKLLLDEILMIC